MKEFTLNRNISRGGFFSSDRVEPHTGFIHADGTKKATQCIVSAGLSYFTKGFKSNYNLSGLNRKTDPVIMFGMYNVLDYAFFAQYPAPVIIVWCGRDSTRIKDSWVNLLKTKTCKHIATHIYGSKDLKNRGIKHEVWPITPGKINLQLAPRGDNVYWYGNIDGDISVKNFYGWHYLPEIEKRTGLKIIKAGPRTYDKAQLAEVYKSSFLALRLTPHDGVPTTVLEAGFMGRKSIFNGAVPHCIPWTGTDDICENVMKEYEDRKNDNAYIAEDIRKFLDIGDKWMYI